MVGSKRVALLYPGDPAARAAMSPANNRFANVAAALAQYGINAEVVQNRVKRAGAESVAVPLELFDHFDAANRLLPGVIQNMQPYKATEEMPHEFVVSHIIGHRH